MTTPPEETGPRSILSLLPLREVRNKRALTYYRTPANPEASAVITAAVDAVEHLPEEVASMLREFRHGDRSTEVYDDETGSRLEGSLVLIPGLEMEITVTMRRRGAIVPQDTPPDLVQMLAETPFSGGTSATMIPVPMPQDTSPQAQQ